MAEISYQTDEAIRIPRLAVLIPCYNEELTIASVVTGFRAALPTASVFVYDNNSSDRTAEIALAAGAVVRSETRQGKGHVVRRMFADVDADIYVLVDGDGTYDSTAALRLVQRLTNETLDFVNCARVSDAVEAYRKGHRLGNFVLTELVRSIFGKQFKDMLSGYKVFSRRFVKSFPATSDGFEIETELTVHALELNMPCGEEQAPYGERPVGSMSKLKTYRDGMRILLLISHLVRNERPLQFFGIMGLILIAIVVLIDFPLIITFVETGLVPRLPTAILSVGLAIIGILSCFTGLILNSVTNMRYEMKRLTYLGISHVSHEQ